jgi:hypothetical protein
MDTVLIEGCRHIKDENSPGAVGVAVYLGPS